ncbi:MAG TPA: asparagine synthase-related protein [Euzebyales bacterium]|nr:asparagine synthase-related protein [Euzebyales bacterium]
MAGLLLAIGRRAGWAPEVVRRLAPALRHYPWLRTRTVEAEPFALALVLHHNVEPPVWHTTRTPQVVVFGEYLHDAGDRLASDLAAHAAAGRWGAVRNGNGLYNLVVWDGERRRLVLANDATGALLLFRARYPEGWIWSSEPGALPRAGRLDVAGLRSLVSIGYQADGRTLDEEITAMPPATTDVIQLVGERITHERHRGLPEPADPCVAFEAAFGELLRDAVGVRLRSAGRVELALTGGLDSRLLLGETLAAGHEVQTFTLASDDLRDLRLAQRVAAAAGVEHRTLAPEPAPVHRHRSLLRGALHTTSDWHAAQQLAICGAARPGRPLLLGFLGDALAGAFVDRRSAVAGVARMRADALAPYRSAVSAQSIAARSIAAPSIAARAIAWCEEPDARDTEAVAELVENLYGRQRRYISYLVRLAWNFGQPICPFADVRLLQHALSARRAELAGQRVRGHRLRRLDPRLARVATTNDAVAIGPVVPRLLRTGIRRTRVMRPIRAMVSVGWGFDYERRRPLADECRELVTDEAGRRLLAGLSPMATLALAPLVMDDLWMDGDTRAAAVELVDSMLGAR